MPGIRKSDRVPILGELHGEIMVFEPLQVKELAPDGATIETAFPLPLNSLHDLRLTLGARSVVLKGCVVHSRISDVDQDVVTYRSGLEFVEMSPRVAAVIDEFLRSLAASRVRSDTA